MDISTGITSTSKEWLNVPYEPNNDIERFVLDMSIADLKKELAITNKALKLACEQIWAMSIWENTKEEVIEDNIKFFKERAKEMK